MLAGARDAQAALDALADSNSTRRRTGCRRSPGIRSATGWRICARRRETASLTQALRTRISAALDRAEAGSSAGRSTHLSFADVAEGLREHYRRARHLIPDGLAGGQRRRTCTTCASAWWRIAIRWSWSSRCGRGSGEAGCAEAQQLRNRLGAYQDLAVLARYAEPHQPLAPWRSRLQSVIGRGRRSMSKAARRIAGRLFAERPHAFRRRIEAMWDGMAASR